MNFSKHAFYSEKDWTEIPLSCDIFHSLDPLGIQQKFRQD